MHSKVFITGKGVISSIGKNAEENYQSLIHKKHGLKYTQLLNTFHKEVFPVCEIDMTNEELIALLGIENPVGYTRTALLGMIAVKEALEDAGIEWKNNTLEKKYKTALINSTTVGGMRHTEEVYLDLLKPDIQSESESYIDTHDLGECTERIADYFGVHSYVTTISTACSSSANSIMLGMRLIQQGIVDRAICGGTDSLSKFTINGFNTLMILDKEHCRPFDNTRVGLNLGEGAGYIILESERIVNHEHKKPTCYVSGFANTNDAFHQTASSPEGDGAYMAMDQALAYAHLKPSDISYINVHGTATPNNDLSEGRAIERLFGTTETPKFSSTKPFTGHTLAACGGIEAVYAMLAIEHQVIFPSLNFKDKMEELTIQPTTDIIENYKVDHVLSNSFGFGGNNSTVIISKVV
ncbi:MAG: beta-ketoacyl-[acyl-carrier-protein] synthase family protein [Bacteroidota bacterium]